MQKRLDFMAKRRTLAVVLFLAAAHFSGAAAPSGEKDATSFFTLDNGLKVFLYARNTLPLVNIAACVNVGAKDETSGAGGLVHLLEHCILYRGTEFRSGADVGRDIRRHGAYFNAHTGLDFSVFEISLPSEFAMFALENQKEILFDLSLSQKELDEEKAVILEEINEIQDDPVRSGTELVYQNLFKNHPYRNPLCGSLESVRAATVEQLEGFYKTYFVPENCAVAVVGDFRLNEMEEKVRHVFEGVNKSGFAPPAFEKAPLLGKAVVVEKEMDVGEGHVIIGAVGPEYGHKDQYAVHVLSEILGGGVNPLLNAALRARRDLVQRASMSYAANRWGGVLLVHLVLAPGDRAPAVREALSFLKKVRNENFSPDDYFGDEKFYAFDFLRSAKNGIRFGAELAQETGLDLARSLAMALLLRDENPSRGYMESILQVTSSDLRKAAAKYLSGGEYVVATIMPVKDKRGR
ncbi:MAG: pitrilysin family protein [Acidobacteriota bacterium]|nr:pitrilysin family protein [Acidobacteriota bacterium]